MFKQNTKIVFWWDSENHCKSWPNFLCSIYFSHISYVPCRKMLFKLILFFSQTKRPSRHRLRKKSPRFRTLHENANLRFFTYICKCKQLPLVIFAGNLWTPEHEWNYRMSLSNRNATPKDLQMQGIYFHVFEQIMSSSQIYHIFDVSLSTYVLLGNVQIWSFICYNAQRPITAAVYNEKWLLENLVNVRGSLHSLGKYANICECYPHLCITLVSFAMIYKSKHAHYICGIFKFFLKQDILLY